VSRLIDAGRLRSLRQACRRTGEIPRPSWWQIRRHTPREQAGNQRAVAHVMRFLLGVLIACGGLLLHKTPLAAQVLTLAGLVMVFARCEQRRQTLDADPGLVLLASLPVSGRDILRHQLRQRWYPQLLTVGEAAGFWALAWSVLGTIPWWWLPVIAITHALLIEAVVLALLPWWKNPFGCLPYPFVFATIWAISAVDKHPGIRPVLESWLLLLAWATPWGWLNQLATHLPRNPYLGASIVMLAFAALVAIRWARERLEAGWQVPLLFREALGRPEQTWGTTDDDDDDPAERSTASPQATRSTTDAPADPAAIMNALAMVRAKPDGGSLLPFGWPGWQVHAWCDAADRRLADLLMPIGAGPAHWRWGMFAATVPALCLLAEVSLVWALAVFAAVMLMRRMLKRGLFVAALMVYAMLQPESANLLGGALPCAAAILLSMPLLGGHWNGMPMGLTVLGSVPRSWWRLMRIMLLLTGLRLLIALPIMGLVLVVLGTGGDGIATALIATALVCVVLWFPWICAMRLTQRTPNDIDIRLGHAGMSALNILSVMLHLASAVMILVGMLQPAVENEWSSFGLTFVGSGVGLSLVTTAGHVALLRHAYRRVIDLV
jgi:hypothetical protein